MAKVLDINSEEYLLGQQIKKYRILNHLTQNQLADLMDMERANLANYENGTKGEMGFKTLKKFSLVLGVPVGVLLGEEEDDLSGSIAQLDEGNRAVVKSVTEGLLLKQRMSI
ncbi:MAG: helix-turn-helix transcriptional regulator [Lachnospiraceae bacterium]|nr:helix-turn-helix transcriptional regulator [Lachnospiraceae bacterium]